MADSQYSYMVQAILNYYSSGSDIWQKVNTGSATPAEIYNAFSYIPQVKVDKGIGGNILGVSYADPLSKLQVVQSEQDIIDSMNSNGLGGSYGGRGFNGNIPADFGYDSSTGQYFIQSGSKSSLGSALSTVADRASLAVTGVNIGCKLGKFIDQTLYDLAPDFWDRYLPGINPATWNTLCGQSEIGDFFLRVLFDVTPDGTTGYISEEALAYYYQMFRDLGVFGDNTNLPDYDGSSTKTITSLLDPLQLIDYCKSLVPRGYIISSTVQSAITSFVNNHPNSVFEVYVNTDNVAYGGWSPLTIKATQTSYNVGDTVTFGTHVSCDMFQTYSSIVRAGEPYNLIDYRTNTSSFDLYEGSISFGTSTFATNVNGTETSGVTGFSDLTGATQYPPQT